MAFAADPSSTTPSLANSFATDTYTGNDGTNPITTGFAPDFTWIKSTTDTRTHSLVDTIRFPYILQSESTAVQWDGASYIQSLDSNGFTVQSNSNFINNSSQNYVSWNWKGGGVGTINTDGTQTSVVSVNQAAGFSIVYSSSASSGNYTWGHGLSKAPELWTYKAVDYAYGWETLYPKTFGVDAGSLTASDWELMLLNSTAAKVTNSHYAADNSVLASVGGGWGQFNKFIAYCWHSVAGYSKIGTFSGNRPSTVTITTGFQPTWVLIKDTSNTEGWAIIDSARGDNLLEAQSTNPQSSYNSVQFTSTGFTVGDSGLVNTSGADILYMAIKEN